MVVHVTLSIALCTTLVGLASTYVIALRQGVRSPQAKGGRTSLKQLHRRLPLIAFNLALLFGTTAIALGSLEHRFSTAPPSPWSVAVDLLVVFAVGDAFFYGWHRLLHQIPFLYRRIHRVHHEAHSPLPIEYIYAHPVEWMVGALGPVVGFAILLGARGTVSAFSLWGYILLRQLHELYIHSGARASVAVPGTPLLGSALHDEHHRRPRSGNYGSLLPFWDRLLGTSSKGARRPR